MFEKVTIIGTGLLGGSLARDLRAHNLASTIIGVCRSSKTAKQALAEHVVDSIEPIAEAVRDADLVVLAIPMQAMEATLKEIKGLLSSNAILTDVGSVKNDLYHQISKTCPELLERFVLAHPIAGGEHSGVGASQLGLFTNKHVIITQTEEVERAAVDRVSALWTAVGAKVIKMSLLEHDAIFAKTSHLPHVIAFALVNFLNQQPDRDRLFDMAAAGFYDFTRIASSNSEMWRDICVTNRTQIVAALDGFRAQLDAVRGNIEHADQDQLLDYFDAAKTARDDGLLKKNGSK